MAWEVSRQRGATEQFVSFVFLYIKKVAVAAKLTELFLKGTHHQRIGPTGSSGFARRC
jgi:hypothetical protein